MYGIVLQNFQKRIQNLYKTYSFHIQISYRADTGLGAVLAQDDKEGKERVIAYEAR